MSETEEVQQADPEQPDLNKPIAERRKKRDLAEQKKFNQQWPHEEVKRPETQPKKSKERGWYRVEGIIGHRITRVKNKDSVELKVKWEDYSEPTWEAFNGFVKDTAPMVERYLIKKSLMKPMQVYSEFKRQKSVEFKSQEENAGGPPKDGKSSYAAFEQYLHQQLVLGASQKTPPITPSASASTPKPGAGSFKPTVVYKEVCCCHAGKKGKQGEITGDSQTVCPRRKFSTSSKNALQVGLET